MNGNARTAETYLAGLGAIGALIAGGVSVFLLVVALVFFDAWPRATTLFGGNGLGVEAVESGAAVAPVRDGAGGDLLVSGERGAALPDTTAAPDGTSPGPGGGGDGGDGDVDTGSPGGGQAPVGDSPPTGGGGGATSSGGGNTGSGGGTLQDTVGGLGETVNNTVSGLGQTVNDTVTGLGTTLDQTVDQVLGQLTGSSASR